MNGTALSAFYVHSDTEKFIHILGTTVSHVVLDSPQFRQIVAKLVADTRTIIRMKLDNQHARIVRLAHL